MTSKPHRLLAWLAIVGGGLAAALAAGWLLITMLALAYGLGEFQGETTARTVILNVLPIVIVGGIPIAIGGLLLRFGLRRLRARPGRT